jgi:tRNA threonylcarbamoyladenosine biosynthesis protein TsaB
MAKILLIETSTALLSTAIVEDGTVVCSEECDELRSHASLTAVFIDRMLKKEGLGMKDFDAVAVSKGPGSYTGLRVGVSTAKGLCFGAGIPLIGIGTLDILAAQACCGVTDVPAQACCGVTDVSTQACCGAAPDEASAPPVRTSVGREKASGNTGAVGSTILPSSGAGWRYIVPMIDARRMEVYCALYTPDGKQLTNVEARIVEPDSFAKELSEGPVLFIGDGAEKCRETIPGGSFVQCYPKASAMAPLAEAAFREGRFEDLAYFEPFYLKDFVATVSRKKLF